MPFRKIISIRVCFVFEIKNWLLLNLNELLLLLYFVECYRIILLSFKASNCVKFQAKQPFNCNRRAILSYCIKFEVHNVIKCWLKRKFKSSYPAGVRLSLDCLKGVIRPYLLALDCGRFVRARNSFRTRRKLANTLKVYKNIRKAIE